MDGGAGRGAVSWNGQRRVSPARRTDVVLLVAGAQTKLLILEVGPGAQLWRRQEDGSQDGRMARPGHTTTLLLFRDGKGRRSGGKEREGGEGG